MLACTWFFLTNNGRSDGPQFCREREGRAREAQLPPSQRQQRVGRLPGWSESDHRADTSPTIIRAAGLHLLPGVHLPAINQVVFLGSCPSCWRERVVILGSASRLDAFSASPFLDVALQPWG